MALGRPPKIIHVYSSKHRKRSHGAFGKLGKFISIIWSSPHLRDIYFAKYYGRGGGNGGVGKKIN